MQRFLFFAVQTRKERAVHLLSRLSNLLQFHVPNCRQFHDMASSVEWISLSFNEPSLFEDIEECHHISAINRKALRQALLGCLANGFKQQQNPIVRGMQFPSTQDLRKLAASFSPQAAQQVGSIGEKALW